MTPGTTGDLTPGSAVESVKELDQCTCVCKINEGVTEHKQVKRTIARRAQLTQSYYKLRCENPQAHTKNQILQPENPVDGQTSQL